MAGNFLGGGRAILWIWWFAASILCMNALIMNIYSI